MPVSSRNVRLTIVIPTLGERDSLSDVVQSLLSYAGRHADLELDLIVSFNPRSPSGPRVQVDEAMCAAAGVSLQVLRPETFQPHSEHHILWCLRWFLRHRAGSGSYVWTLTDFDPIIPQGFDALIQFLRFHEPDIFFVNNLWADTMGEPLPSPAFRTNSPVWHGPASQLFRSQGFEHATSNIGSLILRGDFLSEELLDLFDATIARIEICAHAWWSFEAACRSERFFLLAAPVVANKFNVHHFDHALTWRQNARRNQVATYHAWTVGYLRHLAYYVEQGILSDRDVRTAMISEPQRSILPFLDDVLRRLMAQAKLALVHEHERMSRADLETIHQVFDGAYPLRVPMIRELCKALDVSVTSPTERLRAYKMARKFFAVELSLGTFAVLFVNAFYGFSCYEHVNGFVAVLRKDDVHRAYRDVDPVDVHPFILYAPTMDLLVEKIARARGDVPARDLLDNFDYEPVELRAAIQPLLMLPRLQCWLYSRPEIVSRVLAGLFRPARAMKSFAGKAVRALLR